MSILASYCISVPRVLTRVVAMNAETTIQGCFEYTYSFMLFLQCCCCWIHFSIGLQRVIKKIIIEGSLSYHIFFNNIDYMCLERIYTNITCSHSEVTSHSRLLIYLLNVVDFVMFTFLVSCQFSFWAVNVNFLFYNRNMHTDILLLTINSFHRHPLIQTSVN